MDEKDVAGVFVEGLQELQRGKALVRLLGGTCVGETERSDIALDLICRGAAFFSCKF